ncbi:MAG: glycoside hydrolase family 3 C-terminal domain-containing protein [Clostridia bacterium]|nr:glycoside hydrolase family 3 C-terminal domain-containing protein [Clostridia bacterium]
MELFDYEREHLNILRSHLGECCVLLKKDGSFPLGSPCKIGAYGNGVRKTVKGGTGSGEVNSRCFITAYEGLVRAGFEITTDAWLDSYDAAYSDARCEFIKKIKKEARMNHKLAPVYGMGKVMAEPEYTIPLNIECDTAVYVLSRISGEGADREFVKGDILLTDTEIHDILELNSKCKRFMLILNVGGVVDLTPVAGVNNILILSQLGAQTGDILADLLLGKAYPSGKLTTTWARECDYSHIEFGDKNDTRYREGIYVGYRFFDADGVRVLYPFGHGLSYTDFDIKNTDVSVKNGIFIVKATVENVGKHAGKEVVQCYISTPRAALDKPIKELCGFAKTRELESGEECTVTMEISLDSAASYDEKKEEYVLHGGSYIVYVGNSSRSLKAAAIIDLDGDVSVFKVKNVLGKTDFSDAVPTGIKRKRPENNVPVFHMSSCNDGIREACYNTEEKTEPKIKELTDVGLAYMNVGEFKSALGVLSVIGNASSHVAGAAGESASVIKDVGGRQIIMADGPAGIRVSPCFFVDKKGRAKSVGQSGIPESVLEFLPAVLRKLLTAITGKNKAPKGAELQYRYATALPIGTALAQSWNRELAYLCGDIVGDEMERFGVHLWLAPALNIHRSIRCGRNFEYYSEDPYLSGKIAASVTKGVQSHKGCGVTLKHFAANNQETNRYGSNSIVSERAMREIYLRGFEICIKEADPVAIMTSYNLLNGTHTAEHKGLLHSYLRCELGYDGLVMTDWIVGGGIMADKKDKHPKTTSWKIAEASGDIIMPGCKGDVSSILMGIETGAISRERLEKNASRVYKTAKRLGLIQ